VSGQDINKIINFEGKKVATRKKSASSEEDQQMKPQMKPKSTAKAKKTAARGKKTASKKSPVDEGFDADYQPVVYGQAENKKTTGVNDTAAPSAAASKTASAYPAPIAVMPSSAMDSAKTTMPASSAASPAATAPLSAASLHKQPMVAPTAAMPAASPMPSSSLNLSKMSPSKDGEILRDIKPRENPKDAAFLAPEKFGFDLKKNSVGAKASKGKWINILIYSLSTLIILLTILLFFLTFYSGKIVKDSSTDLSGQQPAATSTSSTSGTQPAAGSTAATTTPAAGSYTFTITNLATDLQTALVALVQGQFKDSSVAVSNNNSNLSLPAVTVDTIFVKAANQPQTVALMSLLSKYGIKPQIQTKLDLPADASLDFVTILPKPDLSGLTSTVYNATGTSGLAKKFCATLTAYKVSNCQPLNATATQTGTTISYKNVSALFTLRRTNEFAAAKYSQADKTQIEDIKVTLGK